MSSDTPKPTTSTSPPPPSSDAEKSKEDADVEQEDLMDMESFDQILGLDEDDERSFSRDMIKEYFGQAVTTFEEMDEALDKKDVELLKDKGHFLKGSSSMLGVKKVSEICEQIQNSAKDALAGKIKDEEALDVIKKALPEGKKEHEVAVKWITTWYRKNAEWDDD